MRVLIARGTRVLIARGTRVLIARGAMVLIARGAMVLIARGTMVLIFVLYGCKQPEYEDAYLKYKGMPILIKSVLISEVIGALFR